MKTLRFLILGWLTMVTVCHAQTTNSGWVNVQDLTRPDVTVMTTNLIQAAMSSRVIPLIGGGGGQPGVPSSPIAEVITPEIQALARGLQNNPLEIYNYVHDHINYVFYFGSKKGAQLTLLEKSGNDFDQCALLAALLSAAGYSNNVSYQFGWMFLPYDNADGSGRDLHHWLQLSLNNTNWDDTVDYLSNLIFYRGYPTYEADFGNNIFAFQRVWVTLTIGATTYYLDPAFKVYQPVAGINLATATGFSSNTLASVTGGTDTGVSISGLNEAALRSKLTSYTTNLLGYLQSNYPNASPQQILGGWQIVASTNTTLPQSLYFTTSDMDGLMPILDWTYEPTNMMSSLTVTFGGLYTEFMMPQLEGQRLSLTFDTNGLGQLWVDDNSVMQSTNTGTGSSTSVELYVHHPVGNWNPTNNTFIDNGAYDADTTYPYQRTNATYNLLYAFEPDWGWLQERQNKLAAYRAQGLPDTSRQVVSETLNVTGLNWLLQTEAAQQLLCQQLSILPMNYQRMGRMAQEGGKGYYVDAYMEANSDFEASGFDTASQDNYGEEEVLKDYFASALESGVIEQLQATNLPAASTVKMLELASTNNQAVYMTYYGNWSSVSGSLTGYDTATLNGIYTNYILQDYFVMLPQNGSNQLAGASSWAGYGYLAYGSSIAMLISGNYHGGYPAQPGPINTPIVQETGDNQPTAFGQTPISTANPTSADPIDTADGTFQVEHTDLSLGQAAPRGVTLSRYYNGTRRYSNPAGMAGGWMHNYSISANTVAAPQAGLGSTTPAQMASMLVASYASINFYNEFQADPGNWLTTMLISKWGVDQLTKGGVSVNLGKDTVQFVKQPNGIYTPPANCTMTLTQSNSAYIFQMRQGNSFRFNPSGLLTNIADQYGQSLNLTYNASNWVSTIKDWQNRNTLTFNYTGSQLTSVSDGTRSVSYGYSTAYNSQGDLTSFTDAEGKTSTYQYDTNHQITASLDAQSRLVVSNAYDSQGHITTQYTQGDTNKAWQLFWTGWQTVEYDPANGVHGYIYDDQGRLTSVIDPLEHEADTIYDGQNHVIYTVSPLLEISQFSYDGNNNLIQQIDPLGSTNQFIYDSQNNLIKTIDPLGNTNTFGYNAQFSLTGQTNGAGDYVNYAYTTSGALAGTLASKTDSGGTTTYGYDSTYGQLNGITYPNGLGSETFAESPFGDVTNHVDARGFTTAFQYNNRRQLTNSIAPTNLVAKIAYDPVGNAASTTDPRGNVSSNIWSVTRHLLSTTLPTTAVGTPVVTNFYDNRDWLVRTVDPLQNATFYTHDLVGQLISQTDPLSRTTTFSYDADGHTVAAVNAANETNSQTWDARGSLIKLTDGAGHFSLRAYDKTGNQITLTNRNGYKWQFQFDRANRLTNTITPLGRSTSLTFNHQGLMSFLKDPAGHTNAYIYDAKGRLTNHTDNVATTLYRYDANDNPTNVSESGLTNAWTFDAYNHVSSYKDIYGNLIQYRYDASGNMTNLIYPGGKNVYYSYDSNNRLTNVLDWSGRKTSMAYDLDGHITHITRPNGTQRIIGYDAAGQTTNILEETAIGFPIALFDLNWTNSGNMAWEFAAPLPHTNTPPTRTMTYDADNRLASVDYNSVTMDADGNLVSGPLTNDTFAAYTFDARNRLLNAGGVTNAYDAMNNRVGQTFGTNVSIFVVNPNSKLPQVLMRIKNSVTNYYIYGAGLLYQVTETATATNTLTYHYDYRGSTVALSDGNGNVTDRIEYSAYGSTTYRAGTSDTPFLFNGRYGVMTDSNGLLYMQSRYYNPFLCRFINPDPSGFGGGLNFYTFANGNPVSLLDPFGLNAQATGDSSSSWLMGVGQEFEGYGDAALNTAKNTGIGLTEWLLGNAEVDSDAVVPAIEQGVQNTWDGLNSTDPRTQGQAFGNGLITVGTLFSPFAESDALQTINPALVRFSQDSISGTFQDGGSIQDLAAGLNNGTVNPNSIPPIRLVSMNDQLFTLDNRRLAAFQLVGIPIPYQMATSQEAAAQAWKFTTQNGGTSIRIRGQ